MLTKKKQIMAIINLKIINDKHNSYKRGNAK